MKFNASNQISCRPWLIFFVMVIFSISVDAKEIPETPPEKEIFPLGDVFKPLIADPKQPRFFGTLAYFQPKGENLENSVFGVVGFGENFGLIRKTDASGNNGWQVGLQAGLFALFNIEADSTPLLNADYVIGLVHTYRQGAASIRSMVYHQSSHLGDEILIGDEELRENRINFSYEAFDIIGAYEWRGFRGYAGGLFAFRIEPSDLDQWGLHTGLEYLGSQKKILGGRLIGGIDMIQYQEMDWDPNLSAKLGLEYGEKGPGNRRVRVLLEAYRGHVPYGQFFETKITSLGAGFAMGF